MTISKHVKGHFVVHKYHEWHTEHTTTSLEGDWTSEQKKQNYVRVLQGRNRYIKLLTASFKDMVCLSRQIVRKALLNNMSSEDVVKAQDVRRSSTM